MLPALTALAYDIDHMLLPRDCRLRLCSLAINQLAGALLNRRFSKVDLL